MYNYSLFHNWDLEKISLIKYI